MALAERGGDKIIIHSEYRERGLIKLIPGARWNDGDKTWELPLSWAGCVQLRSVFGEDLQVGPELGEWARNERDTRVNPCLELRISEDAEDLAFLNKLRPFQRAGVMFLSIARQALLADEMGLGKTVQAIATLEVIGDEAYPALIVSPNSMKLTWAEEFKRWAPGRRVVVIQGGKKSKEGQIAQVRDGEADVLVINWEALRLHTRLAGYGNMNLSEAEKTPKELNEVPFKSVVADEAHKAKDPHAKQTRALWFMGGQVEQAGGNVRLCLTGTPVANSPEDIWSLMRFVSPREFPAKTKFIDRYAQSSWNGWGGLQVIGVKSETRDELFRILDPRLIRRTKEMVLPQLPAKQYTVRTVELGSKQRKAYEQIRKQMVAELDGGTLVATNPLAKLTRLLQFASASGEIQDDGVILVDPSCKVDALEEIVAELGGEKAVIFSESVQLINLAHKRLVKNKYRVGLVTGAVTGMDRHQNVLDFNENRTQLLLVTLGAGGEGLSLTGASIEVFLQRSFSAVKNSQAEDRLHGIGRGVEGQALEVIDVVAVDTIEAHVHAVMREKAEKLEQVVRDQETLRAWLSK